jgi:hypothetical protein
MKGRKEKDALEKHITTRFYYMSFVYRLFYKIILNVNKSLKRLLNLPSLKRYDVLEFMISRFIELEFLENSYLHGIKTLSDFPINIL